ncbi:hypothetical protein [Sabulicella glaciei]|uniref:Uncharacterized protein n=1 Tax=Sabulicella glaciei TaxID=2984948 RepID=A0ABT3NSC6_9PROT|nr:hypothetical protein [Roseococcus sp. MDT2-1-1]MCW8085065.1 hypothetical protein [Roseococcus sp. MDT2-1-1]
MAEARGDARGTVQSQKPSRPVAAPVRNASRSAAPARAAAGPAASSARQQASRQAPARNGRATARQAATTNSRMQVAQRGRSTAPVPYSRHQTAASQGLRQSAMATCTMRGGRRVCAPAAAAQPRNVSFRWGSDLPPMTMAQTSCPDGTMATMALGHTDVIRCVPL